MTNNEHRYTIEIQYLGFRYHGWALQKNVKTVQGQIEKTLRYIYPEIKLKTLGSGRTDAMVSAEQTLFELFIWTKVDTNSFLEIFNQNLPADIKALSIQHSDRTLNIIQNSKFKEYHYIFAHGQKAHPFAAPFMACFTEHLNIEQMTEAAKLMEGTHNFINFCHAPKEGLDPIRTIQSASIAINSELTASFFPENSFIFKVVGAGFMRYQVRLMMGALIRVGKGELPLQDLLKGLQPTPLPLIKFVAPASGLMVHQVKLSPHEPWKKSK